jgi:methionine synthase I (cobalamin-dependent)
VTRLNEQSRALKVFLRDHILILDGAVVMMLQKLHLTTSDFGGFALEGYNGNLIRTHTIRRR